MRNIYLKMTNDWEKERIYRPVICGCARRTPNVSATLNEKANPGITNTVLRERQVGAG